MTPSSFSVRFDRVPRLLAAWVELGLVPEAVVYEGDPEAFALASNIARRHLSKGQRAMVAAQAHRIKNIRRSLSDIADEVGVAKASIGHANTVLDWVPGLAADVVSGALPLNKAYDIARERNGVHSHAHMS